MTVDQAFNQAAAQYDDWVHKALPNYDLIFGVAKEILPYGPDSVIRVLDLGAGTGLFSQHVQEKYPRATFVLYDLAEKMLDVARGRFQDYPDQFQYVTGDLRDLHSLAEFASFDLVISSLAIHHLTDGEKRALFRRVCALLSQGGLFVNVDQIKGPTTSLQELYWARWLANVRHKGASEGQIQGSIQRRRTYDQDAWLVDQLAWLNEAGFADVDCIYKHYFIGVFFAQKGG